MASFFKKALNVFVEFEDDQSSKPTSSSPQSPSSHTPIARTPESHAEAEKFEKYFDRLFDQANLPGPDYYEFYKMMETLEAHIHDEKARFAATFASLSIQGLTKQTLLDTAGKYKAIIEKDKADFEKALTDKLNQEVGKRHTDLENLEKKMRDNSELIQKLTKEIADSQVSIGKLKTEIMEEEGKLNKNSNGYRVASEAVVHKILTDIHKIQTSL